MFHAIPRNIEGKSLDQDGGGENDCGGVFG